jgi:hypothetical protein
MPCSKLVVVNKLEWTFALSYGACATQWPRHQTTHRWMRNNLPQLKSVSSARGALLCPCYVAVSRHSTLFQTGTWHRRDRCTDPCETCTRMHCMRETSTIDPSRGDSYSNDWRRLTQLTGNAFSLTAAGEYMRAPRACSRRAARAAGGGGAPRARELLVY